MGTSPLIGWVGTGRMGAAMVERLLAGGYDVAVWNRTRAKTQPLARAGARVVEGPGDLADRDVVFTMVASSDDLLTVLNGPGGLLTGASAPAVIVDSSTVSSDASAEARAAVNTAGSEFLAAPVSGNPKAIKAGKMLFAVSGPRGVFDEVRPILQTMGRGAVHVGDGEVARLVKLCHNLYLGVVIQSLVEVTSMAQAGGVSRDAFLRFLNESPMGSTFTRYKSPALVNLDFSPTFTMSLLRKDLTLGLTEAEGLGVPLRVAQLVGRIVQEAIDNGYGEEDFAALLAHQSDLARLELESEKVAVDDGLHPSGPPEAD